MCLLLHDIIIKGKSFVLLHKDRDNFFANAIAIMKRLALSNLLNGK